MRAAAQCRELGGMFSAVVAEEVEAEKIRQAALDTVRKDVEEAKVVWYNKSLAYVSCDNPNIKWVTNQMLLPDGKVRPRFVQHFEQFLQVSLQPVGQVLGYFFSH